MMSFKSFMRSQLDDVPHEEYRRRYDHMCRDYVHDFSETFFQSNKGEDWFQERYNPIRWVLQENEIKLWAASESNVIKESLKRDSVAELTAMRLNPSGIKSNALLSGSTVEVAGEC